ncbi:acyltransferase family protein [Agrococcus beijingensis]|uniref:acyltransferase family protein n=1 Tax=Agrococcus beijingensis TaxID=3068634 RepID=UPI00274169A6|nr:acyltransferase [Agrococcus sp. REN33]
MRHRDRESAAEPVTVERDGARFARFPSAVGPSISVALSGRDNSLGILRLVLASAVIFSHAWPIGGWGADPMAARFDEQENLGGIAVLGFFAISGYLITKSGQSGDALRFLWHRVLRIMPAYWCVLLFAALVLGPLWWVGEGRPLGDYWSMGPGGPLTYLTANWDLTIRQYGIHDVFASNPYGASGGSVMNGSLWTLSYEFFAYLVVCVTVLFGVLTSVKVVVPVITGLLLAVQVALLTGAPGALSTIPFLTDRYFVGLTLMFMIGGTIAVYGKTIPLHDGLAMLAALVFVFSAFKGGLGIVGYPAFAYLLLYLAARLPRRIQWIGQKNDYSYGIYLYGWPVQQTLAWLGVHEWGYVPFVVTALIGAAGLAWLSWHGVERWALTIKDRGPGRGWRALWRSATRRA